jgi:hypothetical protein
MNDWARVLEDTKRRLSPCNFATRLCEKRLTETYRELLQAVLQEVGLPDTRLEFICSERSLLHRALP